jgi:hypothetical protein
VPAQLSRGEAKRETLGGDRPMICDVHAHYVPKAFSDFMGERFGPRVGVLVKTGITRHPVSDSIDDTRVPTSVRRIKLAMPSAFPYQTEFRAAHAALTTIAN